MRVLFITRKWHPAVGGMETYCRELTAELAGLVDLTVEALPGRPDGRRPSAPAHLGFGLRMIGYLLRRAGRFDAIHLADMSIWPLALAVRLRHPNAVLVASAHGTDVAYPRRAGLLAFLYGLYLRAGSSALPGLRVIANSRATAGLCAEAGYTNPTVVPLATRISGRDDDRRTGGGDYVLYVGRLVARKGCGWFIREVLPRLDGKIRLKVAGTPWDESERRALGDSRVDFLGPVFGEDLARLRRQAIAVVMPNVPLGKRDFVEGFGLAALEAVADGGILCAARLDGIVDAVHDGETGFLLPAGDGEAWAGRIGELADWPRARRRDFIARARAVVAAEYSWSRVANETFDVYRPGGAAEPESAP